MNCAVNWMRLCQSTLRFGCTTCPSKQQAHFKFDWLAVQWNWEKINGTRLFHRENYHSLQSVQLSRRLMTESYRSSRGICRSMYPLIQLKNDEIWHGIYPVDFLITLSVTGMPPHKLCLKVGVLIILMCNINGEQGLCNGTRLKVCHLSPICIGAMILTGTQEGKKVFLPRIITDKAWLGFTSPALLKTISGSSGFCDDKAQGQSVHHLGLYLPQHVCAYGQFYVTLSRVISRSNIKLLLEEEDHQEQDSICIKNVAVSGNYSVL